MAAADSKDGRLAGLLRGEAAHRSLPSDLVSVLQRKLEYLEAAAALSDLRSPPANRLEALSGDRRGSFSIRVNDQFWLCFAWTPLGPSAVELVDYH